MQTYYYYKTFRRTIINFCDIFNDIKIGRYNADGTLIKTVTVPIRFSPKSKAYLYIKENGRDEEMLPMISIDLQSIDFDAARLGNRHESVVVSKDTSTLVSSLYKNAVPYNLTFNVRIWALNMVDVDQIYEQMLPYFAPYVFMRVNIPELDTTVEVKVVLQSCSPEITDDVAEEEARVIRWSTMFVCHTWLFKPLKDVDVIGKIITNYYTSLDAFNLRDTTSTFTSGASGTDAYSSYLEGIGYDDEARLMYNYETFGDS